MIITERSQAEKTTYCMIPTIGHSGKSKATETIKQSLVARGGMNRQNTGKF